MMIYTTSDTSATIEQVGGKAFNLFRLQAAGLRVPEWIVLDQQLLADAIPETLKTGQHAEEIRNFIDAYPLPNEVINAIAQFTRKSKASHFSVRSSALPEDGKLHSFAGQFESHLYVCPADIPNYIRAVWKSNFSERVYSYLKANKLQPHFGIGVIIQEMIDPEVSGVAFGIDPSTGKKDSKIICAVFGVGEGLVSGQLNADTYTLSGDAIQEQIAIKTHAARRGDSGQIRLTEVPEAEQLKSSLTSKKIREIQQILDLLEKKLGAPQDIEFAIRENVLYLLQTRPVTAVIEAKKTPKNRIIWDNSNIIESYPGVTTPLTFSYILSAYKNVYLQLAEIMGASPKALRENESTFGNMLGLIHGRVYYNLLSWYKVLALFPGYRLNARFMENMMGVKERFELPKQKQSSWILAALRTGRMILHIVYHRFTIKRTTRKFMADIQAHLDIIKRQNLATLSAYELKELWVDLDQNITAKWKAPLINDSFAMIYFGKLQKLIEKYAISNNTNIQNDLLCGSKDIISVEPIHRSIELATNIASDPILQQIFRELQPDQIWHKIQDPQHLDFLNQITAYLDKFGERCVGELKLETISYKQEPALFIAMLKSFVIQGVTKASTESGLDIQLRQQAENQVNQFLRYRPYKKWKLRQTLKKARYFVSNRENLRYERTRVFGITREVFCQIGIRFQEAGVLENPRDIFYLTKEEIFAFIGGTAVSTDFKSLVKIRREEYARYEEMEVPAERFTTFETVNSGNNFYAEMNAPLQGEALAGLGCCPGIVRAKVRLVKHPKEVASLDGDILVTSSTDPGWVTLFPTSSGILVERGSLLSHSAIVSREMGIPCIVGVTGLLKTLKTGDLIEMNGSTGTIKILNHG